MQTQGQVQDLGGGTFGVTGAPGATGDTSPNYADDPLVNSVVKLPSLAEAMAYKRSNPSFHGVQRPGDYQRVVQREMANQATGGRLDQAVENRAEGARAARGDFSASPYATARAMGGFQGVRGGDEAATARAMGDAQIMRGMGDPRNARGRDERTRRLARGSSL